MNRRLTTVAQEEIELEITWGHRFREMQQASIEDQLENALMQGSLRACSVCGLMKVVVFGMDLFNVQFQSMVDCACGRLAAQQFNGETFLSKTN